MMMEMLQTDASANHFFFIFFVCFPPQTCFYFVFQCFQHDPFEISLLFYLRILLIFMLFHMKCVYIYILNVKLEVWPP